MKRFFKQDYRLLLEYYLWKYSKLLKPVQRRSGQSIPEDIECPFCGAPNKYIYDNNGGKGQYQCEICQQTFSPDEHSTSPLKLYCPYCGHALVAKKARKHFVVHKYVNKSCSYYKHNLKNLSKDLPQEEKHKCKLHYSYREFTVDFFSMDLNQLPN